MSNAVIWVFSSHSPSLTSSHFLERFKVYEEAGSDFHQVAYFKTRIGLRNALREEISGSSDREAVLITLNRPIVFAQPVAFDRGIVEKIARNLCSYWGRDLFFSKGLFIWDPVCVMLSSWEIWEISSMPTDW